MKLLATVFVSLALCAPLAFAAGDASKDDSMVVMHTNLGDITIEVFEDDAPKSAANFLQYVRDGFYDGTIFHRVIPGFVIQGGGFTRDLSRKSTRAPIRNEAKETLPNLRGTIAMARTAVLDSASAQFFINVEDNSRNLDANGGGYAVFGKVTSGLEVADKIKGVATTRLPIGMGDVPVEKVEIISVKRK